MMDVSSADWETIVVTDGPCPPDALTVYRQVSDEYVHDVMTAGGFPYPPNDKVYAGGQGGIYFSTCIEDVLRLARTDAGNNGRHYFKCWVPAPSRTIVLTDDNRLDVMRSRTSETTLVHNVRYSGTDAHPEYVSAGQEGDRFQPFRMHFVRKRDQSR